MKARLIYSIIFIPLLLLFSCGKSTESRYNEASTKICSELKPGLSGKSILSSKQYFTEAFAKEIKAGKTNFAEYYNRLVTCFAEAKFDKKLEPFGPDPISGNGKEYFSLDKATVPVMLENGAVPAFAAEYYLRVIKKLTDTTNAAVLSTLTLFDESKNIIKEYTLYPTPEFLKKIIAGKGEIFFRAPLDIAWNPASSAPFDESTAAVRNLERARFYRLAIEIQTSSTQKQNDEQNKEYQEIIDDIKIN